MKTLAVWWGSSRVGTLTQDDFGDLEFTYDQAWVEDASSPAISISLPKRSASYGRRETRAFFDGLLPEAETRRVVAQILGVSPGNPFALLERLGGEVAGALSLLSPELTPEPEADTEPHTLTDDELLNLLRELPTRPLLAGDGRRLSLAGAQNKLPIVLRDDRVALPGHGVPSSHILKIPDSRFEGMTENEGFVSALAKHAGLRAVSATPRAVQGLPYLLVERYDRVRTPRGTRARLHQEDFCQAMGIIPERKYASEGGPGFRQCSELLRRVATVPATETLALLDYAIFHVLVGNADAHGKNYSLLYEGRNVVLAPLYDALSTIVYPELNRSLAMTIDGKSTLEQLGRKHWERFGSNIGFTKTFVPKRVKRLAERVLHNIDGAVTVLSAESDTAQRLRNLGDLIARRCEIALQSVRAA